MRLEGENFSARSATRHVESDGGRRLGGLYGATATVGLALQTQNQLGLLQDLVR